MGLTAKEAGIACDREMITRQIELLLTQLESQKYSKRANWAARIEGGIEQLLYVRDGKDGAAGDVLPRMRRAVDLVMADEPDAPGMVGEMHPALADNPKHVQQLQSVTQPPGPPVAQPNQGSEKPPGPPVVNPPPTQPHQPASPPPGATSPDNPLRQ